MTNLICPFKFMTNHMVKDCVEDKCALWAKERKFTDYDKGRPAGSMYKITIVFAHCSLNTSPDKHERTE